MNKIFTYILMFSLTLLVAGCAKEIAGQEDMMERPKDVIEAPGGELTVQVSVPSEADVSIESEAVAIPFSGVPVM